MEGALPSNQCIRAHLWTGGPACITSRTLSELDITMMLSRNRFVWHSGLSPTHKRCSPLFVSSNTFSSFKFRTKLEERFSTPRLHQSRSDDVIGWVCTHTHIHTYTERERERERHVSMDLERGCPVPSRREKNPVTPHPIKPSPRTPHPAHNRGADRPVPAARVRSVGGPACILSLTGRLSPARSRRSSSRFPATFKTDSVCASTRIVLGSNTSFSPGGSIWFSRCSSSKYGQCCNPSTTEIALWPSLC